MSQTFDGPGNDDSTRWYDGITRYQWLVLLIASLGWVFDVFEGQIFVASMNEAMPSLVPDEVAEFDSEQRSGYLRYYNNIALGAFLLGGALGGVVFGIMSDRIGRKKTMSITILMYSLFTCVSALSQAWWHMAGFRFLVAMGVGGEWAVASAMVAEVFPRRARAWSLGIFHASSVFGTLLAIAAGAFIVGNPYFHSTEYPSLPWRLGFLVGVLPAFLIIWVRRSLHEPEHWEQARTSALTDFGKQMGSFSELFEGQLLRHTLVGVGLAAVGLATFWGAHIYGKDLLRRDVLPFYIPSDETAVTEAERRATITDVLQTVRPQLSTATALDQATQQQVTDAVHEQFVAHDLRSAALTVEPVAAVEDRRSSQSVDSLQEALAAIVEAERGEQQAFQVVANRNDIEPRVVFETTAESQATQFQALAELAQKEIVQRIKWWEMFGMLLVTCGGGLGLLSFGPLCERIGRRAAFLLFHLGGLASAIVCFQFLSGWQVLVGVLPVFGFLTLGMHAGYAIYFPELFPTRLRGTGGGFCFNVGRILAAPILFLSGWMQKEQGFTLEEAASILSLLFLLGAFLIAFAPETRGQELPE